MCTCDTLSSLSVTTNLQKAILMLINFVSFSSGNRNVTYVSPIQPESKNQNDKEQSYGCDYDAITERLTHNYATSWGPIGFKKINHPLATMVR